MARKRENQQQKAASAGAVQKPVETTWPLWGRMLLSALLAWHVFVVFISPLSVPPSSELVARIAQPTQFSDQLNWLGAQWYSDPLYLNHGYHFFAPEPPVNQLMRYAVLDDAGAVIAEGEFPNKDQQWPRLYYHRHMMLADQAPLAPGGSQDESIRLSLRSYARYLLRRHEGAEARLDCVQHRQLVPRQVMDGADPNAPETFSSVASVVERRADLESPLLPGVIPETLPPGGTP